MAYGYNPYMTQQYPQQQPYIPQQQFAYMDRLSQLQSQQQMQPTLMSGANQSFPTLGKIVDSIESVKSMDIPMDGNMYYFPKADGTEIFVKQWLPNATTQILTFKPVFEQKVDNTTPNNEKLNIGLSDEVTEVFMTIFNDITERLDKLEKVFHPTGRNEVKEDE